MYILNVDVDDAQTNGVCPQVMDMGSGYPWDAPESVTRMRSGRPLDVSPNLRSFHLYPETNATDLVSQGYIFAAGLLASPAFCAALEGRRVQAHERYPAQVVHGGEVLPYWWLHMTEELEERIDFVRSTFTLRPGDGRSEEAVFADVDEFTRTRRALRNAGPGSVLARRVAFAPGTPPLDLFYLLVDGGTLFVSDALADELTRRGLTGFELLPTDAEFTFG
ncbi:MAG TPA: hypothetical protein VF142_16820 [Longimicrobium sp.]